MPNWIFYPPPWPQQALPKVVPDDGSQILFDAASSSGYQTGVSSYSWSHTCNGANRILVVEVSMLGGSSVTSITYNSVALTLKRTDTAGPDRSEIWYLVAPAIGVNTIAVAVSGSVTSVGNAASYVNVDQVTPIVADHGTTSTSTTASDSVTTIDVGDWVVGSLATISTTAIASERERARGAGALGIGAISDTGPIAVPASTSITWTALGIGSTWAVGTIALRPNAAPPNPPPSVDTWLVPKPIYAQLAWWQLPPPRVQQKLPSILASLPAGGSQPPVTGGQAALQSLINTAWQNNLVQQYQPHAPSMGGMPAGGGGAPQIVAAGSIIANYGGVVQAG